jgi:hypothetical protein
VKNVEKIGAILGYVGLAAVIFLLGWGAIRIYLGIPADVQDILVKNYMVVVIFPFWSLLAWIGVFLAGQANQGTFNVKLWGLEFSGGGGAAVIWVLATTVGNLLIAQYWRP